MLSQKFLSVLRPGVVRMTTADLLIIENRMETLEVRVSRPETWAGPGQAEVLVSAMRSTRIELARVRQTQDRHTRMIKGLQADVATLKTDIAGLKADMAEVKTAVSEILRRLPPQPG